MFSIGESESTSFHESLKMALHQIACLHQITIIVGIRNMLQIKIWLILIQNLYNVWAYNNYWILF